MIRGYILINILQAISETSLSMSITSSGTDSQTIMFVLKSLQLQQKCTSGPTIPATLMLRPLEFVYKFLNECDAVADLSPT